MCLPDCSLEETFLQERLALAQDEYQRGLSKLRQTASELQRLSGRVHGSEKTARGERPAAVPRLRLRLAGVNAARVCCRGGTRRPAGLVGRVAPTPRAAGCCGQLDVGVGFVFTLIHSEVVMQCARVWLCWRTGRPAVSVSYSCSAGYSTGKHVPALANFSLRLYSSRLVGESGDVE